MAKVIQIAVVILLTCTLGCSTYYQKNEKFNNFLISGNYEAADRILNTQQKQAEGNNRVIHFFNKGVVAFMMGNYAQSNEYFRQADMYIEDLSKNIGLEAFALISNPSVKPYKPEDFESVMIHYYMALNHLFLNDFEGAIVECRRINLQLQAINDKYQTGKNKYTVDAFAHNLMGIVYEASGDYNNAFIAYRNAFNAYEEVYLPLFNIAPPQVLKLSLIRSARLTGFYEEEAFYRSKFDLNDTPAKEGESTVVVFWMNGLSPYKAEWGINFMNDGFNNGHITLSDSEMGMSFPVFIGNKSSVEQSAFKNLSLLRVAFPRYMERPPSFYQAQLELNSEIIEFEMAQNINKIAFQCLNDRMIREIGSGIARLATKKALEALANRQNENLGTVVSLINAMTEKADTRNWQSLPYSISYARINVDGGNNTIQFKATGQSFTKNESLSVETKAGKTKFVVIHTH